MLDVVVVGGGIVGLATAKALSEEHNLTVRVLEKEASLGLHQTGRNSGVIHSGLYYKPGSLKATLCTEGRERLIRFCEEEGVAFERCGKVVVATEEKELGPLEELERRGLANGLREIKRLTREELAEIEPNARGISALSLIHI